MICSEPEPIVAESETTVSGPDVVVWVSKRQMVYVFGFSETKKAPKLNFLGKFCRQKSLLKFWPMGGQKKV